MRDNNIPINDPILLEKALESGKALNYGDIKSSNGWSRWLSYDVKNICMTLKRFRFSTIWVFPPFLFYFLNCTDIAKDPIIRKIV